jgi:hypothetical protein
MYSQSRILLVLGFVLIAVLLGCGILLRWYLRRRKSIRAR